MHRNTQDSSKELRFDVRPRYTPGSPALVDYATAHALARSEHKNYDAAISWSLDANHEKARRLGLNGIIRELWESNGVMHYRDLMTGQRGRVAKGNVFIPIPHSESK